ncbi:MAG: hypothetical protein H7Y42_03580, partial [Chitinophagaceae bacterium]|nr:hypothetical protein [Chitinophagaceae bacterium]
MFKRATQIFLALTCYFASHSQQPGAALNRFSDRAPVEKIYLHLDRQQYISGQSIWFKAYLSSEGLPAVTTSTIYIELINQQSSIVYRQVLPVFGGFSRGQLELADTLPGGAYILRAYTQPMLNHDADFLFKKNLFIYGKASSSQTVISHTKGAYRLEFFPEGGNFVSGLSNSIAFKATDEKGLPILVSGTIKKESGETVTTFSSVHDGMGFFDLNADESSRYYAELNGDAVKKHYLPALTTKGIVFRIINMGRDRQFEIVQRKDDQKFRGAFMVGQMQHKVVFTTALRDDKDEITGMIKTAGLSSGILHITVFNKDGLPIAERLTFLDNKEYIQEGDIRTDTLGFGDRAFNRFTLSLKDTVKGSFSISIYDPAMDTTIRRHENIISSMLLTSDLKGYIHNPAYYFSANTDSVQNALDLVMMTNGWRRFNWTAVMKDTTTVNKFRDGGYINLSGKINLQGTRKPLANQDLMTLIMTQSSGRNVQLLRTDAAGGFRMDSMMFYGRALISFNDIKGRKSKFVDVLPDGDSLRRNFPLPKEFPGEHVLPASPAQQKKLVVEYDAIVRAEGLMLEGVTVQGKKKSKLEETEEKYVSPLFSGNSNHTMDVTEENLDPYRNIFEYLRSRVPGLWIGTDPEDAGYVVRYRQQASASSLGEFPMAIFLNEVPTDVDAISSIPAHEVALVKVYSSFAGASGNAPGGVLAIYTKKGTDRRSLPKSGDVIAYEGYSVVKEFYSPNYSDDSTKIKTDNRPTLYWNSSIVVADIQASIPIRF